MYMAFNSQLLTLKLTSKIAFYTTVYTRFCMYMFTYMYTHQSRKHAVTTVQHAHPSDLATVDSTSLQM